MIQTHRFLHNYNFMYHTIWIRSFFGYIIRIGQGQLKCEKFTLFFE